MYSKQTITYEWENITIEEVMGKLYMFQPRFGKFDEFGKFNEFGMWNLERIQTDAGIQFTSKEFQEYFSVRGVKLTLSALDHQEVNGQV